MLGQQLVRRVAADGDGAGVAVILGVAEIEIPLEAQLKRSCHFYLTKAEDYDLKLEKMAVPDLREGIAYCESIQDYISRNLLKDILESEEEHIDWLETQLSLIEKVGLQNYLQSKMES